MDGAAPLSIPFGSIDRYAARHEIEGDDFTYFSRMIRAMDEAALDHWRKQDGSATDEPKVEGREMTAELFDAVFG